MPIDLVTVGHIVLDKVKMRGVVEVGPRPGGPCVYSSLAARSLDGSVAIFSKVGRDFGNKLILWLENRGAAVTGIKVSGPSTTSFEIHYENGRRSMKVTSTCNSLGPRDLSELPQSSAIQIAPVLHEISAPLALNLTRRQSVVALDPQGYVRRLTASGMVRMSKWSHSILRNVDVLKVSGNELNAIVPGAGQTRRLRKLGSEIVLLTRGANGTIAWSKEHGAFNVPPFPVAVRDPTGAGDVLLGAFLVTWIRTFDFLWSVSIGSAAASFLISGNRPLSFGTRKHIERRAATILDGVTKI